MSLRKFIMSKPKPKVPQGEDDLYFVRRVHNQSPFRGKDPEWLQGLMVDLPVNIEGSLLRLKNNSGEDKLQFAIVIEHDHIRFDVVKNSSIPFEEQEMQLGIMMNLIDQVKFGFDTNTGGEPFPCIFGGKAVNIFHLN